MTDFFETEVDNSEPKDGKKKINKNQEQTSKKKKNKKRGNQEESDSDVSSEQGESSSNEKKETSTTVYMKNAATLQIFARTSKQLLDSTRKGRNMLLSSMQLMIGKS